MLFSCEKYSRSCSFPMNNTPQHMGFVLFTYTEPPHG